MTNKRTEPVDVEEITIDEPVMKDGKAVGRIAVAGDAQKEKRDGK